MERVPKRVWEHSIPLKQTIYSLVVIFKYIRPEGPFVRHRQRTNNQQQQKGYYYYLPFLTECSRTFFWYKSTVLNIWYINWIIMKNQRRVSASEKEAHRLVIKNFRRESGSSVCHVYDLGTHWMIQNKKVFLPSTFPQSSGQSSKTKEKNKQRRTSNCG